MMKRKAALRLRQIAIWMLRLLVAVLVLTVVASTLRILWLQQLPTSTYQPVAQLADPDGKFAMVDGVKLYYRERGPQDGPPVVLVHGFLLESAPFDPLLSAFAEAGYRTIAVDRPPFGLSDKRSELDYSTRGQGDQIFGLMDALGISQAALLGHSAAGPLIADMALRNPQRVSALILVAPAFRDTGGNADENTSVTQNPALGAIFTMLVQGANPIDAWAQQELRAFFTPEQVATFGRANYTQPELVPATQFDTLARFQKVQGWEDGFQAFGRQMLQDTQLQITALNQLTMPVLVVWGEQDRFVAPSVAQTVASTIPAAQQVALPHCGHIPWSGCAPDAVPSMLGFLKQVH